MKSAGGYFRTMVMTKVKANLAKIIKANSISVLELDEHIDMISAGLKDAINPELAEYGLTMPEFYVSNIVTPDDDPNFRRMKQQYADKYLKVREEEIRKAEAEAAFERKTVEAQTEARMRVIGAQGEHLLLADGKRRKVASPKRKKCGHVSPLGASGHPAVQKLKSGQPVSDRELRRALGAFRDELGRDQGGN